MWPVTTILPWSYHHEFKEYKGITAAQQEKIRDTRFRNKQESTEAKRWTDRTQKQNR